MENSTMALTKYEELSIPKREEVNFIETLRFLLVSDIHLAYS
jgi:Icc-related predicted phosphoesterase